MDKRTEELKQVLVNAWLDIQAVYENEGELLVNALEEAMENNGYDYEDYPMPEDEEQAIYEMCAEDTQCKILDIIDRVRDYLEANCDYEDGCEDDENMFKYKCSLLLEKDVFDYPQYDTTEGLVHMFESVLISAKCMDKAKEMLDNMWRRLVDDGNAVVKTA